MAAHLARHNALEVLGDVAAFRRDFASAVRWHREAVDMRQRAHPAGHPEIGRALAALAEAMLGAGYSAAEATRSAASGLAILSERLPAQHPDPARASALCSRLAARAAAAQ
jgi:hypothetical protein